jgi:uncharacterized protein
MRCPVDGTRLVELDRNDVLIDACPECRGVWLDRGELDRILERDRRASVADPEEDFYAEMGGAKERGKGGAVAAPRNADELAKLAKAGLEAYAKAKGSGSHGSSYGKKRKKSVLGELFDF